MDPYPFVWPDPRNPRMITRDLTVLRGGRAKKGKPKPEPLVLRDARLIELIPHILYEVPKDCHADAEGVPELRPGCILSRNLRLSRDLYGHSLASESQQCFVSYKDVYRARRGAGHADRRYRTSEIPANKRLSGRLDQLVQMSWNLHKTDADGQAAFILIASTAAAEYGSPQDPDKVAAQERTLQAGNPVDSRGRFNPTRIPLICLAADNHIARRILAIRSKGRRMGFREAVLEHYIDQLHAICKDVSRSQAERLHPKWLKADRFRTPRAAQSQADVLQGDSDRLSAIMARPFCHAFARSAVDLQEGSRLLSVAARDRDEKPIDLARVEIGKVYHAMVLVDARYVLEGILYELGAMEDRGEELHPKLQQMWSQDLYRLNRLLRSRVRLTDKWLEEGYANPVLPQVLPRIECARQALNRSLARGGPDFAMLKHELQLACEPL